ncbi:hypothetical protein LSAT2_029663 [Lamellibrachia satsuma]|nr:hypothetical protein LSAT2_029663 [Lamellibrachia satsuma]
MSDAKYNLPLRSDLPLTHENHSKRRHKTPEQLWRMDEKKKTLPKREYKRAGSQFMIGKQWIFIKDGLDDFRDGLPPPSDQDVIINPNRGLAPNVQGQLQSGKWIYKVKEQAVHRRYTKEEMCYTKLTPIQRQRRTHIQEIEYGLLQHPLALYPHLEECLPSELFEDVIDMLDPEMNLVTEDEDDYDNDDDDMLDEVEFIVHKVDDKSSDKVITAQESSVEEQHKVRNPYRWLAWKEEREKKDRKRMGERHVQSPCQDEHIKSVTKDFCDWVASLGGEANNIEESTITSLFASGYETKPALSVPIHVVELTNIPPELRMSTRIQSETPGFNKSMPGESTEDGVKWGYSGSYIPSWSKFRYGAWYLPTKLWKRRGINEPLEDPKQLKKEEKSRAKKNSSNLDNELASLHGANAFMEFIDKKSVRRPEFLNHVAEIKEEQQREEEAKVEAEMAKLKKHHSVVAAVQ